MQTGMSPTLKSHKRPVNTIDTWDITRAEVVRAEILIPADLSYVTVP